MQTVAKQMIFIGELMGTIGNEMDPSKQYGLGNDENMSVAHIQTCGYMHLSMFTSMSMSMSVSMPMSM